MDPPPLSALPESNAYDTSGISFCKTSVTDNQYNIAQEVFHEFMRSVQAASNELKEFGELYKSEESQKVLSRAKKSREANPYGIMPWRAKDHPHWYDLDVDDTP